MLLKNKLRFKGQTLVVTGGGGEIGLQTALYLAAEGASLALLDIDKDKLNSAHMQLTSEGYKVKVYTCDIQSYDHVEETLKTVCQDFGRIDLLFNNAGYQGVFHPIHKYPVKDFDTLININITGAFYVLRATSAIMVEQQGGNIVNTASMAGVDGPPNMAAYGASKFAIVGLTQTAAKDLAPHNIRVNAISPAFMGPGYMWDRQVHLQAEAKTQYFSTSPEEVSRQMIDAVPMRRCGAISEIPPVVAFLMSDESSYITGSNIPISGGISF